MAAVAVADQRVCLPLEGRNPDGSSARQWVSLRDLLRDHLSNISSSDEERIALVLMGAGPTVWLEALGTADGVARTFRVGGALNIEPNPKPEDRHRMDMEKVAFMWDIPRAGIHLRFPSGVRADSAKDIDYTGFRRLTQ